MKIEVEKQRKEEEAKSEVIENNSHALMIDARELDAQLARTRYREGDVLEKFEEDKMNIRVEINQAKADMVVMFKEK